MKAMERMRALDRRAEAFGQRFHREYDKPMPAALKYGYYAFVTLTAMTIPLTFATSLLVTFAVLAVTLVVYMTAVGIWVRRHRV